MKVQGLGLLKVQGLGLLKVQGLGLRPRRTRTPSRSRLPVGLNTQLATKAFPGDALASSAAQGAGESALVLSLPSAPRTAAMPATHTAAAQARTPSHRPASRRSADARGMASTAGYKTKIGPACCANFACSASSSEHSPATKTRAGGVCVCVRERECVCVCVCREFVRDRETERQRDRETERQK